MSAPQLLRLSQILGTTPSWLLGVEEPLLYLEEDDYGRHWDVIGVPSLIEEL